MSKLYLLNWVKIIEKHKIICLSSVVLLSFLPAIAQGQQLNSQENVTQSSNSAEDQALFESIFGRPQHQNSIQQVVVPFFINEQAQGQIKILLLSTESQVQWQAKQFLEKTAEIVRSDIQEKLLAAVDREGHLSLEALRQIGLIANFDQRQLQLHVQVSPAQRRTNIQSLRQEKLPPGVENAIHPSTLSGYVNLRGGQDLVWSAEQAGRQPLRLSVDGAVNYKGWVLEGSADFREGGKPAWESGDLRLLRDHPERSLRYIIGDLSVPVTGYQSSRPMVGVTVAKNFALQPYRVTRPINEYEFFLESPSKVEVLINGRLVQTLQLAPGKQNIRDLPLSGGINEVQLVITDPVGRVQRLSFPTAVASELLAPGLQQFAYSLGFPSSKKGSRSYDFTQPALTLSHRWGITDNLTLGGYLQADLQQQILGFEGAWATAYGNFGWDLAMSHASSVGTDYAFKVRYDYSKGGNVNASPPNFGLTLEHRGSRFAKLNSDADDTSSFDLTAYYRQKIWGMSANLSGSYEFGSDASADAYNISLGLVKSFGNGLGVNLNLNHRQDTTGKDEQSAYLSLSWFLPRKRQSITVTTAVSSADGLSNKLTWNQSSRKTIGGINTSLGLAHNSDGVGLTSRLSYTGYRAVFDFSHGMTLTQDADETMSHVSRLTFGTAFVFADGHFGWSRPINNSFALLVPHDNLRAYKIGINPSGNGYTAQIDRRGAAVVPIQPYRVSTIRLDAAELPIGYSLGSDSHTVLPSYKSGTLIRVGSNATVILKGVLVDSNNNPVTLQAGEITSLTQQDQQPLQLFTNKTGRFVVEGLQPGKYELTLFSDRPTKIHFEIPQEQIGIYDIGKLKLTLDSNNL
ncbi:fimbrial biogenesis outer membrane usher protein [Gloeocapsopsis crepidinum LEGE 06123]|uniref:Fimbrial biogenesis outer membrane usher protein n=1 Tax=Gloeocapsopsis crepidinum LEGE 06123 TaxID=588587 RepID=A0ABR9UTT6_9CHRO|nr:fimbrial biogenesis outer membrane usher protein [Gloeocapsopsis crepidinum LEGE 06123]